MQAELVVTDPRAIKVLLSEQGTTYLEAYLGATRSVSQAAAWAGRSIQRTHYWTRRLCDVGLVEVRSVTPRGGRPIRGYRAVADSFRIQAKALPVGLFASMMTVLNHALVRSFETAHPDVVHDGDVWIHPGANASGIVFERTRPGSNETAEASMPDAIQSSFTTRLSPEDAAALRRELADLRDRWAARTAPRDSGRPAYLTMLAMTPLTDDTTSGK